MRIGKDMILLTKKNSILSVLFLSRTFIESEKISKTIFVPMPSFSEADLSQWLGQDNSRAALDKVISLYSIGKMIHNSRRISI